MKKRRGSLALRLLALGVVQVALIVVVGDWLIRQVQPMRSGALIAGLVGEIARANFGEESQASILTDLRVRYGVEATLYTDEPDAKLIASSASPPLPPQGALPETPPIPRMERARFEQRGKAYVIVTRFSRPPPRGVPPPMVNFVTGLAIVAMSAFGIARWVVKPLQELSRAARALGSGDLRARAALARNDELGELGRTFDEMAERIEQLMLAEKELLANVSHELRTPLARIRVALDLASEGDGGDARSAVDEIRVDLAELERLIDDILTAVRLEVGAPAVKLPLHLEATSPAELATNAADRFRAGHPTRPLEVTVDPNLPAICADALLLRRVFDNLLDNADKYSPDPSTSVAIRVTVEDQHVAFEVSDRGIGIPAEDLPHLFTAFFRGERSRSRGTGGVGLGLTLAKRITDAHGGTIDAASSGAGSTFRVRVPKAT